jgi:hypothetical protein
VLPYSVVLGEASALKDVGACVMTKLVSADDAA